AEGLGLHNNLLYQILAEEYLKLGKPEEAKLAIERLIGLNKNSTNYALAGQIALNLSDTVLAEQYYQKSINKEPNIPSLSALSKIYSNKGDMELAGDYINKALEIAPDQIPNLYQKAKILGSLTLVDSAKNIYQHIIILDSSQSEFHYELAEIYYEQYKYDSAKVFVEKSLRLNASDISAQLLRARIQNRMTDYEESISSYKAILAQDSTYNLAQLELDNLQRKVAYLRRLDQERRALDSARRNAPALIDRKGIDN
ncbi:MAG: tetratricopeptide repeat protein, partial [Bacteroidota bacterium]